MTTYVKFTHVDATTGVPCTEEPMTHGPAFPALPNLRYDFALESEYPTDKATLFGQCDDNFDPQTPGLLGTMTKAEYDAAKAKEMSARLNLAKREMYDNIANKRWRVESAGITVSTLDGVTLPVPMKVLSAIDDQLRINSVLSQMERDQRPQVSFKAANNTWVDMTYDSLKFVASLIADHVQACFNAERDHAMAVAQLQNVDAVRGYDYTTGWPTN